MTFTKDYGQALFSAFNIIFNKDNHIKHIDCYFHFINKIAFCKNNIKY